MKAHRVFTAAIAVAEPSLRLRAVLAAHEKLLTAIARKRREIERFEAQIHAAMSKVAHHVAPVAEEMRRLDAELHAMLAAVAKKRSKREQRQIDKMRRDLERAGVLSPREHAHHDHDDVGGEDFEPEAPATAAKQTDAGALRALFRSLVDALHPDKVQDEAEKAVRTEIMKDLTVAYTDGDFARMLEIQRMWAAEAPLTERSDGGEVDRRHAVLEAANDELRRQLRALTLDLRALRASNDGQLARAVKRSSDVARVVGPIDEELDELRRVHAFVEAFHKGKMTFEEFLAGPVSEDDDEDDEGFFSIAVDELFEMMEEPPARRRRR